MSGDRVNPFGDLNDFEPAQLKERRPKPVEKAVIDQVATDNGFPSRQPVKPGTTPAPRQQRRYTTGRNQQINIKATPETIERLNALADRMNVPLGEVLARALSALEKAS
jgi:hypothetical protein